MVRFIAMVTAILLFAGCTHSNGVGMDALSKDAVKEWNFQELYVHWRGALSAKSISRTVIIAPGRKMTAKAALEEEFVRVTSCDVTAGIDAETYTELLQQIADADIANYRPAQEDCTTPGQQGVVISYTRADGFINTIDTGLCAIEPKIQTFIDFVQQLSEEIVPNCTSTGLWDDYYGGEDGTDTGDVPDDGDVTGGGDDGTQTPDEVPVDGGEVTTDTLAGSWAIVENGCANDGSDLVIEQEDETLIFTGGFDYQELEDHFFGTIEDGAIEFTISGSDAVASCSAEVSGTMLTGSCEVTGDQDESCDFSYERY